jgi:hypothetical protein
VHAPGAVVCHSDGDLAPAVPAGNSRQGKFAPSGRWVLHGANVAGPCCATVPRGCDRHAAGVARLSRKAPAVRGWKASHRGCRSGDRDRRRLVETARKVLTEPGIGRLQLRAARGRPFTEVSWPAGTLSALRWVSRVRSLSSVAVTARPRVDRAGRGGAGARGGNAGARGANQPKVWDRSFTTGRDRGGTGLGLSG